MILKMIKCTLWYRPRNINQNFLMTFAISFFRFQYVVLPEQEALKEKVETDLLSEGRYEPNK